MSMFSSRPPFNDDLKPWVYFDGTRREAPMNQHPENPYRVLWHHDPRPEFDSPQHNPTNPILSTFRKDLIEPGGEESIATLAWSWVRALAAGKSAFTLGQGKRAVEHAHKVLTRLASLAKEKP